MNDATSKRDPDSRILTDDTAEASWRYLYTRLGPRRFQDLCSAVLVASGKPDVVCLPGDQADDGRDAVDGGTVFQYKWSKHRPKDPAQWLAATLKSERPKIEKLVAAGRCDEYVLMTNVAGTARIGSGSIDRVGDITREMTRTLKIPVRCMWQHDLDAAIDGATDALKWSFVEMLAGVDLFRCLIADDKPTEDDRRLRKLVSRVSAFQWHQDATIKFEQVDLRKQRLGFLYIDSDAMTASNERGSALLILSVTGSSALVHGAPGQGKSTLAQALCQAHRRHFVDESQIDAADVLSIDLDRPLLPLRLDVRNYASWLTGGNPFDPATSTRRNRSRPDPTVETYMADQLQYQSGGLPTTSEDVHALLDRFACLVVFDGLDEVGSEKRRTQVVDEIDAFMARHLTHGLGHQVVITTRPNAVGLAEPGHPKLSRLRLLPLSAQKQRHYLDRWSKARELDPVEHERLRGLFEERSRHPHVQQLADNPMQLAILLYLIHTMGESVPSARTALYEAYVDRLLVREGHKSKVVASKRQELIDVTSFLGWQIHSATESKSTDGRLPTSEIKRLIRQHLTETGAIKDPDDKSVEVLFDSATQRVWALASKAEGTFEFDVQSIREYFAAKYLFDYAGAGSLRGFDRGQILRELLRRPYWLNVLRFYAGFLPPADLRGAVLSIEEEFASDLDPQSRIGAWLLVSDGALSQLPFAQERAVALFAGDIYNRRVVYNAIFAESLLPVLPATRGGDDFARALMTALTAGKRGVDPEDARLLSSHLPVNATDFDSWWHDLLQADRSTTVDDATPAVHPTAANSWAIGVPLASGPRVPVPLLEQTVPTYDSATAILECGIRGRFSALEDRLLQAVLAGWASEATPAGQNEAADLLRVLSPSLLSSKIISEHKLQMWPAGRSRFVQVAAEDREAALTRLIGADRSYAPLRNVPGMRRAAPASGIAYGGNANHGHGWTFADARTVVTALTSIHGTCWLPAELASLAVLTARTGQDRDRTSVATSTATPLSIEAYIDQVRLHGHSPQWWTGRSKTTDQVHAALWCLGLVTYAQPMVINPCIRRLNTVLDSLDADMTRALVESSGRLALHTTRTVKPRQAVRIRMQEANDVARILLGHRFGFSADLPLPAIAEAGRFGNAAWPAREILMQRLRASTGLRETVSALRVFGPLVEVPPEVVTKLAKSRGRWTLDVLADPTFYPAAVVVAAAAGRKVRPGLGEVAAEHGWFDFGW